MDNLECRICYEYEDIEKNYKLIYPCSCKLPVHETCLIKWIKNRPINQNNHDNKNLKCEICKNVYKIKFDNDLVVNNNSLINYYENRRNLIYYNRVYLICLLNCCNLFSKFSFFFIIFTFTYIIFKI